MINLRWKGIDDLKDVTVLLEKRVFDQAAGATDEAAETAVKDIRSSWSASSPSSPGNPPAVVTGALDASVSSEQKLASGNTVATEIKAEAGHAGYNEFGTSKMAARPFMQPAVNRLRHTFPIIAKRRITL